MNLAIPCVRGAAAVRDLRYAIFYRVVFCTCVFAVARIVAWYSIFAAAFGRKPSFSGAEKLLFVYCRTVTSIFVQYNINYLSILNCPVGLLCVWDIEGSFL